MAHSGGGCKTCGGRGWDIQNWSISNGIFAGTSDFLDCPFIGYSRFFFSVVVATDLRDDFTAGLFVGANLDPPLHLVVVVDIHTFMSYPVVVDIHTFMSYPVVYDTHLIDICIGDYCDTHVVGLSRRLALGGIWPWSPVARWAGVDIRSCRPNPTPLLISLWKCQFLYPLL